MFSLKPKPTAFGKETQKIKPAPSGLHSGWDTSTIKHKTVAPDIKSNTEDDNPLVQYGGMIADNEDDEVERKVVVNDKVSKRGPSDYVHISLSSLILVSGKLNKDSVIAHKDRSGGIHSSHATRSPRWKRKKVEARTPSKRNIRRVYKPANTSRKKSRRLSFSLGGSFKGTSSQAHGQYIWVSKVHRSGCPN